MEPIPSLCRLLRLVESESMRQIIDLSTTPGYVNASTCGIFAGKGRCGLGFRNLPHTSVLGFRKCGENHELPTRPRLYASTTCGFVGKNRVMLGAYRFFPHFLENGRYDSGVRGEEWCTRQKSTEEKAIQWPTAVLGSVVGVTVAASLYRMRSARHNSPFGIFERRL